MLKWHEGKDHFLFLDNDSNQVWKQLSGHWLPPDEDFYQRWGSRHSARVAICHELRARYFHVIVPNKETSLIDIAGYHIAGELLVDPKSPVSRVLEHPFAGKAQIFYSPTELASPKYFFVTDSHWNHLGALRYLTKAFQAFGISHLSSFLMEKITGWEDITFQGDLGLHAGLPPEHDRKPVFDTAAELVFENSVINEGYTRHYYNKKAPVHRRLLIMHDSTVHRLYDALATLYRESLFVHCPDFDPVFAERYGADDVIFMQMERFTVRLSSNEASYLEFIHNKELSGGGDARFIEYVANASLLRGRRW